MATIPPQSPINSVRVRNTQYSPIGRLLSVGWFEKAKPQYMNEMRYFGSYAVVYIYDGGGTYRDVLGYRCDIGAGDLIIVFPDFGHRYSPNDGGWSELYYVFDGPVFDLWRDNGLLDPRRAVRRLSPVDHWLRRWQSIAPSMDAMDPPLVELCRLQQVLAEALSSPPPQEDDQQRWQARACALLEADLSQSLDLTSVAQSLDMSYASFRRRFREQMNMSPGRYRAVRTIDRACELMQRSDMPIRAIADRLGFCDEFHFSKRFKQITGVAPSAYRASLP